MRLYVAPCVFDWIQLWGIGWKLKYFEVSVLANPGLNFPGPMSSQSIPDHKDLSAGKVQLELLQEANALDGTDIFSRM